MTRTLLAILALICSWGAVSASEITTVETIYQRPGGSSYKHDEMLKVHFIDVGGADAILIDTSSDKKILIDGGYSWSSRGNTAKEYHTYLNQYLGDDIVDLIVISHPDYDHFAGLAKVLEDYVVRQVWSTGYDSQELSGSWRKLVRQLAEDPDTLFVSPLGSFFELGSVIRVDDAGTYDKADDTVLTIVNTQERLPKNAYGNQERSLNESQRRNSASIVLRLDYGENSILFTGDTNGREKGSADAAHDDQEKFMVDNNNNPNNVLHLSLDVDILKVAHHGSDGSSSLEFLKAVSPVWAVITAGFPHGHPHDGPIRRLKHPDVGLTDDKILRTDAGDDATGNKANEKNLGDDTIVFALDPEGIVSIKKMNIKL